jgi:hypothetical protein
MNATGRKAGFSLNFDKALTDEEKRKKVIRAMRFRREGYSKEIIQRRCGYTKIETLKKWAADLGIPWSWGKGGAA